MIAATILLTCNIFIQTSYAWYEIKVQDDLKMIVHSFKTYRTAFASSESNPGGTTYTGCWGAEDCISVRESNYPTPGYREALITRDSKDTWHPCK
jgi:hypothetical protein